MGSFTDLLGVYVQMMDACFIFVSVRPAFFLKSGLERCFFFFTYRCLSMVRWREQLRRLSVNIINACHERIIRRNGLPCEELVGGFVQGKDARTYRGESSRTASGFEKK